MALPTNNISMNSLRLELQYASGSNISLDNLVANAINTSSEIFSGSFHNVSMTTGDFASVIGFPYLTGGGSRLDWRGYNHDEVFYQAVGVDTTGTAFDVEVEMWLYDAVFNRSSIFTTIVPAGSGQDLGGPGGPPMYSHGDYYIGFTISIGPPPFPRTPIVIDLVANEDLFSSVGANCTLDIANGFAGWNLNPGAGGSPFDAVAFVDNTNGVNPDWIPWNRCPRIEFRIIDL